MTGQREEKKEKEKEEKKEEEKKEEKIFLDGRAHGPIKGSTRGPCGSQNCNMILRNLRGRGGVKGRLEFYRKFICF